MKTYTPFWSPSDGRWHLGQRDLHCGDCFQLRLAHSGPWHDVRIEHSQGEWYVIGLPFGSDNKALNIYEARLYD